MGNDHSSETTTMRASTRTGTSFGDFEDVPMPTDAKEGFVVCEIRAAAVRERFLFLKITHNTQMVINERALSFFSQNHTRYTNVDK